ncbi:MAG: copper resistance protein NlpE [Prosthecochloris sp.]|nr:copper resistance protein NlpE [Prosthecochloris sp.]
MLMKPGLTITACLILMSLPSCGMKHGAMMTEQSPATTPLQDTSRTSLDWNGTYRGILPCADCEGIETVITLHPDGTYRKTTTYLGRNQKVFIDEGTFTWNRGGSTVRLDGYDCGPRHYRVGENHLLQLDMQQRIITGRLADAYRLDKID